MKTTLFVIDTETTGLEASDRVVEVAVLTALLEVSLEQNGKSMNNLTPAFKATSVVRPEPWVDVHPKARANHHIPDEEIRAAPRLVEVLGKFPVPSKNDVVVGHNLEFDERMLRQSGGQVLLAERRVCTYRCAKHIWPDAQGYSNQALRYWQKLDCNPSGHAHRALYDVLVTYALLRRMLEKCTLATLEEYTRNVPLQAICKLKKHVGQQWERVPSDYMKWILNARDPFSDEIQATCRFWLKMRGELK